MALRFRRSVKLAPGLRLNFSGSGASLTVGPRGASVNFGSRGTYMNSSLPGTGLYTRSRLGAAPSKPSAQPEKVRVGATVLVEDDGTVTFVDANGQPLSDYLINLAKRQQGAKIRELLEDTSSKITAGTEALGRIHCHTPRPDDVPTYARHQFGQTVPQIPVLKKVGLIARLLGKRGQIESENAELQHHFESALSRWRSEKALFEAQQDEEGRKFDTRLRTDIEFMHQALEESLCAIVWPRETLVSFEVSGEGGSAAIDVDLPEIEDLPRKTASVPERGYKLSMKELKGKALQNLYSRHVHGVGFRIIGDVFATLPTVQEVILSAYTQRDLPATGHQSDTYIYSVRIPRREWTKINFDNLSAVDIISAFEQFELRRKIGPNGVLESIVPL